MGFFSSIFKKKESVVSESISENRDDIKKSLFEHNMQRVNEEEIFADPVVMSPAIDKRESECPNCGHHLDKIPERSKKCPHCGKKIYTYASEISPGVWERHLRKESEGDAHYAAIREEQEKFERETNDPNNINAELDEIAQNFSRVKITGSGCDRCYDKMETSISIEEARELVGKPLSAECECPYFFRPDPTSRTA